MHSNSSGNRSNGLNSQRQNCGRPHHPEAATRAPPGHCGRRL